MTQVVVFHHPGVELARQTQDSHHGQQQRGNKALREQRRLERLHDILALTERLPKIHGAIKQPEQAVQPDHHKSDDLDKRLKTDCQHQTGLMLGGINMPGAKQQREKGHENGHHQRGVHLRRGIVLEDIIE